MAVAAMLDGKAWQTAQATLIAGVDWWQWWRQQLNRQWTARQKGLTAIDGSSDGASIGSCSNGLIARLDRRLKQHWLQQSLNSNSNNSMTAGGSMWWHWLDGNLDGDGWMALVRSQQWLYGSTATDCLRVGSSNSGCWDGLMAIVTGLTERLVGNRGLKQWRSWRWLNGNNNGLMMSVGNVAQHSF